MFCFEIPSVMGSGEFLLQAGPDEAVGEKEPRPRSQTACILYERQIHVTTATNKQRTPNIDAIRKKPWIRPTSSAFCVSTRGNSSKEIMTSLSRTHALPDRESILLQRNSEATLLGTFSAFTGVLSCS